MEEVANTELSEDNIPPPDAGWNEIGRFALTFDGYKHWGSFEKCAEVAKARAHDTLTGLRTCLFFMQRSWRYRGRRPSEGAMAYARELLAGIREKVRNGQLD